MSRCPVSDCPTIQPLKFLGTCSFLVLERVVGSKLWLWKLSIASWRLVTFYLSEGCTDMCSSWMLSVPGYDSGNKELMVLPRHIKVIVTSITGQKSASVGLRGVFKKVVGLGGWHMLAGTWENSHMDD